MLGFCQVWAIDKKSGSLYHAWIMHINSIEQNDTVNARAHRKIRITAFIAGLQGLGVFGLSYIGKDAVGAQSERITDAMIILFGGSLFFFSVAGIRFFKETKRFANVNKKFRR